MNIANPGCPGWWFQNQLRKLPILIGDLQEGDRTSAVTVKLRRRIG